MSEMFRRVYRHNHISYHFAANDNGHVDVTAEDATGNITSFKMLKGQSTDWKIIDGAELPEWTVEAVPYLAAHLDGEL